jgi:hypothetical protein
VALAETGSATVLHPAVSGDPNFRTENSAPSTRIRDLMRRTNSTLLNTLGVEGKLVADQLGHTFDVNRNVYTHSPVAVRREALNRLEQALT